MIAVYCPDCREEMIVLEVDRVEVDFCLKCQGIWLDEGELEILLGSMDEKGLFIESFQVDHQSNEKKRKCPVCHKKMDKVLVNQPEADAKSLDRDPGLSVGSGQVIIDACPKKHGLWFDHGELITTLKLGGLEGNQKVYQLIKDLFTDSYSGE